MRLLPSFNGSQSKNNFTIASSLDSEFTPIIVLQLLEYHRVRTKSFYVYKKPRVGFNNDMKIGTYNSFNDCIQKSQRVSTYNFKDSKGLILATFKVGKHYIADKDDRVLLTLCTRENNVKYYYEYSSSNDIENIAHDEGLKELVLLVSTELLSKPEYQMFWKKFEKDYIQDCYKSGIEVRFTTCEKIEKLCFSNNFKVEYQNVEQLLYHMKTVIPLLAIKRGEDVAFETIHGSLDSSFVPAEEYLYDVREKYRIQDVIRRRNERGNSYERQLDELLDREANESERRRQEVITFTGELNLTSNSEITVSYSGGEILGDVQFADVQLIDDVTERDDLGLTLHERHESLQNHLLNMQEIQQIQEYEDAAQANDVEYEEIPPSSDNGYHLGSDVATGTSMSIGRSGYFNLEGDGIQIEDDSDDLPFD